MTSVGGLWPVEGGSEQPHTPLEDHGSSLFSLVSMAESLSLSLCCVALTRSENRDPVAGTGGWSNTAEKRLASKKRDTIVRLSLYLSLCMRS
jgi:hypothetical protein